MENLSIVESLFKMIRERRSQLHSVLTEGIIVDFTEFKVVRARANELDRIEQDFKDLLKRKFNESDDSKG